MEVHLVVVRMKKITILGIVIFLLFPIVYSLSSCLEIQSPGVDCVVLTPVIDCSTYDLYNSSLDLTIDDGAMSQIGSTGIYNFTFNQSDSGVHKILLCDNTTATIQVANYSNKDIFDDLQTIISTDGNWLSNLVKKVWAHLVGYEDPSGDSLNASDSLKTIAENTEAGGY